MKRAHEELLIVGGVVILLAMSTKKQIPWGLGWHWPVPDFNPQAGPLAGRRYPATISQEFHSGHHGLDIMYDRRSVQPQSVVDAVFPPPPVADAQGAKQHRRYFAPMNTPILAAREGRVWSVRFVPGRGWYVVLDHGVPWATMYGHLHTVSVSNVRGTPVTAGQQIGTMGYATADAEKLRHLHFEAWLNGGDWRAAEDPADVIDTWERATWTP